MTSRLQLKLAAQVVNAGGVIAYPTESVFGLGCDPHNSAAVARILALKERASNKGFILIAANLKQIWPFITELPKSQKQQILASWPGPVTWILPARADVPLWLTGGRSTIAIRVTSHSVAAALCLACKVPLVSTSANRARKAPMRRQLQVRCYFNKAVDYIVPGQCGQEPRPSRIIDASTGIILR